MDKDLYKKTDGVLFNYKSIKAEINITILGRSEYQCR